MEKIVSFLGQRLQSPADRGVSLTSLHTGSFSEAGLAPGYEAVRLATGTRLPSSKGFVKKC